MEKEQFNKLKLITSLTKIAHSDEKNKSEEAKINNIYKLYGDISTKTVNADPYLFAHFLAWNHKNGKINDSKVAFPVFALLGNDVFHENALSHLCKLGPRELMRSYKLAMKFSSLLTPKAKKLFRIAVQNYLLIRESHIKWWTSCVVQNRKAMKSLYAISHCKHRPFVHSILWEHEYSKGSVFDIIKRLKDMQPKEAAGHIINHKIPLTVAIGSVSSIKNKYILFALLEGISGNELLNNTKMFERLGVFQDQALKFAYDEAIERAKKDKKVNVYKASKAKAQVENEKVSEKLISVQKEQEKKQKGIEGDWLILGDCSYSMTPTIDIARRIAALISSQVKGKIYLVFFNTEPKFFNVTGLSYQEIYDKTKFIVAYGNTSIGCGLDYIDKKDIIVNGIVIASDGGDNTYPLFNDAYRRYIEKFMVEPSVYHLWMPGDYDRLTMDYIQKIDLSQNFDEYAYSNLLNILKANRYQLLDDILNTPLLTFEQVFKEK